VSNLGKHISSHGLDHHGLSPSKDVYWNLAASELMEQAIQRGEGQLSVGGALVTDTGHHTGRSPNDKFTVEEPSSKDKVWWGKVNRPISEDNFSVLRKEVVDHLDAQDLFVFDGWAGAHPAHRLPIRVVNQHAWHNKFAQNMFIEATPAEKQKHVPEFTVLHAPDFQADPARHGTNS